MTERHRLLILHFKFQFSKSIKSSTFHIFLNLTYPLRKNVSFPKCPKITQKFTQNHQTEVNEMSRKIQRRLKRDRVICRKAVLSDVKTAFMCTPASTEENQSVNIYDAPLNYSPPPPTNPFPHQEKLNIIFYLIQKNATIFQRQVAKFKTFSGTSRAYRNLIYESGERAI